MTRSKPDHISSDIWYYQPKPWWKPLSFWRGGSFQLYSRQDGNRGPQPTVIIESLKFVLEQAQQKTVKLVLGGAKYQYDNDIRYVVQTVYFRTVAEALAFKLAYLDIH